MRIAVGLALVLGLAACGGGAPEQSSSGPGFTDYDTYLDQRAAEIAAARAGAQYGAAPQTGFSTEVIAGAIDAAEAPQPLPEPILDTAARPRGDAPATIQAESGEVEDFVSEGVSDEQDFAAVSARETIESDKARIEANRAQYVVIQPGSLPVRPGEIGPNIVEYALATTNPVGVALYDRGGIVLTAHDRACAKYASPDQAQQAFLASGGPASDRRNLDPDGDGFACDWDPTAFRIALQ